MKKIFLPLTTLGFIIFTSCDSDNKKNEVNEPLTAEQNKELMQNIGVEFVNELSAMQQLDGVGAVASFGLLIESEDEEEMPGDGRVAGAKSLTRIAKTILGFTYGKLSSVEFGHMAYRVNQDDSEDEFESLEDLFNENTGTFVWDFDEEDFVFTDNSEDKVIFKYPAEADGTSNNATLTLSNYAGVVIDNPLDEEYEGDLPTSLDLSLEVDGSVSMIYGFDIDYSADGVPETVDTELTVGEYSLSVGLTNTNTKIGADVNFMNGSKTLIAVASEVNGDFTDEAIDSAEDSEDPTDIVDNGSFSVTLIDLKFAAALDFASLYNEIADLEFYYYEGDDEARPDLEGNAETSETALNKHAKLAATYVSTGKKAADVEFYTFIEKDEEYGEEYVELGARMIFEDESKVDVEDFLETGFDNLEDAINDLLDQIGEDLDEDLDHIDFGDLD